MALPGNKAIKFSSPWNFPEKLLLYGIGVTTLFFILFVISNYFAGIVSSRVMHGGIQVGTALYWLTGLGIIPYLQFILLGMVLRPSLVGKENFFIVFFLLSSMYLVSLTGGREAIFRIVLFFLGGSLYSKLSRKKLRMLIVGIFSFFVILFIVTRVVRSDNYSESGVAHHLERTQQRMTRLHENWKGHLYNNIFRVANNLAGQLVIDHVVKHQDYIGFKNFDRLATIFLPRFIVKDQKTANDGEERLIESYGLPPTENITFLADSFERGGYSITFLASILVSFWLTLVGRLISKIPIPLFSYFVFVAFFYRSIFLQQFSVLGAIREITYSFFRDGLLIGAVISIIYLFYRNREYLKLKFG